MPVTYELISSNVLSTAAASVTFSSIPATYTDLVLRWSARNTTLAAVDNNIKLSLNGTQAYSVTIISGDGSTASSYRTSNNTTNIYMENGMTGTTATANTFTNCEVYIPSYTASQNKPLSAFNAAESNSATGVRISASAGLQRSTDAINSVTLDTGFSNFSVGSSFYLYGIKNS